MVVCTGGRGRGAEGTANRMSRVGLRLIKVDSPRYESRDLAVLVAMHERLLLGCFLERKL